MTARLSKRKVEKVLQTYALTENCSETARRTKLSEGTVRKYVREAIENPDPHVNAIRQKTLGRLAARCAVKADEALDHVTPKKLEDASLAQLGIFAGIMSDKTKMLSEYTQKMSNEHALNRLPMPDDVKEVENLIIREVKSIKEFKVHFREAVPELAQETEDTLKEIARVESAIAIDDFDGNPSE